MTVAVVGSRPPKEPATTQQRTRFASLANQCIAFMRALPAGVKIVSGGALGIDSVAEREAKRRQLGFEPFWPDWEKHGRRAGFVRNKQIVDASDWVVAFWDGSSSGTAHTIQLARMAGKLRCIIGHDGQEIKL